MGEAPWALFPKGTPRGAAGLQKRRWVKRPSVASGDSPQLRLTRWRVEVGPFVPETWRIDGTARGPDGGSQGHPAAPRSTPRGPAAVGPGRRGTSQRALCRQGRRSAVLTPLSGPGHQPRP